MKRSNSKLLTKTTYIFLICFLTFYSKASIRDNSIKKSLSLYKSASFNLSPKTNTYALSYIHTELNKGIQILKSYKYWTIRDQENKKHIVNFLSKKGEALLVELKDFDPSNSIPEEIDIMLKKIPSKKNLDLNLFIEIIPEVHDKEEREEYFKELGVLLIHKGCYRQCAFCAYNASTRYEKIPYPLIIKTLHELSKVRRSKRKILYLYKDNDPLDYYDKAMNADITDILAEMKKLGLKTEINNNGWNNLSNKMNLIAKKIAKFFSEGTLTHLNLSYHLFYENLIKAVTNNDKNTIQKTLHKYKQNYKNAIIHLTRYKPLTVLLKYDSESSFFEPENLPREIVEISKLQITLFKEIENELVAEHNLWEKQSLINFIDEEFLNQKLSAVYQTLFPKLPQAELNKRSTHLINILKETRSLSMIFAKQNHLNVEETLEKRLSWIERKYDSYSPINVQDDTQVLKELFSIIKDYKYYITQENDITWDFEKGIETLNKLAHKNFVFDDKNFLGFEYMFNPSGTITDDLHDDLPQFYSPKHELKTHNPEIFTKSS